MNITNTSLNRLMQKYDIKSDYALAKKLGVTPGSLSNWRKEKSQMADDVAIRAAELLGIDSGVMLAQLQEERATSDETKKAWRHIAGKLRQSAAMLIVGIAAITGFFSPSPARAATEQFAHFQYYDKNS